MGVDPNGHEHLDYRSIFDAAPGPHLILRPDHRFTILAVNEAYLRATMTTRGGLVGCGLFDAFPDNPDDPAASGARNLRESLEHVLAHRQPHTMAVQKYDIRRPDGGFEERYWNPINSPVFASDGAIACVVHCVVDVTEFARLKAREGEQDRATEELRGRAKRMEVEVFRHATRLEQVNADLRRQVQDREHAEAALAREQDFLKAVLDNAADGIVACDAEGVLRFFNRATRAFHGLPEQPLPPEQWAEHYDLFQADGRTRMTKEQVPLFRALEEGVVKDVEMVIAASGHPPRLLTASGRAITDPDGRKLGAVVVMHDLTARKQAEQQRERAAREEAARKGAEASAGRLAESQERYRSLFASIDQGFCVIELLFDSEGRPVDYRFVEANPAFEQQTGLVDAVGRTARELVPGLEDRWVEIYGRVARTGEPIRFEEPSDKMGRWFDVYAFRLDDPSAAKIAVLFKDITAGKRIEREREHLLKSEQSARGEAEALVRVGRSLSAELDLERLVQSATDAVTDLAGAAFGAFFYDVPGSGAGRTRRYTVSGVTGAASYDFPTPRTAELFEATLRGGPAVRSDDVDVDDRFGTPAPREDAPDENLAIRSFLAVPVRSRSGEVLGGVFAAHPGYARFTPRHQALVEGLAAQAAVAIDNARLYEDLKSSSDATERGLAQLRAVVDSMAEGLVLSDPQGNLLEWNPAALEIHGYARIEDVQQRLAEFPEILELSTANGHVLPLDDWPMSRVLRGEHFSNFEVRIRRLDIDLIRVISYSGSPVRDRHGKVALAVLTLHDITAERRAQAAIRQSEGRMRAVFEQSTAGIAQIDSEGRFILVNQWLCDLLGYERDELLRLGMNDVTHPDDLPRNLEILEKSKAGGGNFNIEKRCRRKDGTDVWVNVSSSLLRAEDGRPHTVLGVIIDLTERKLAEAEVARAKEEAEHNLRQWRVVVESMTEGLVLSDPDGNLLSMNPAALAIHQFASMGEMLKRFADYPGLFELRDIGGEVLPVDRWPIARALGGERFSGYEVEVYRRDTRSRWIGSYGGAAVRDESGRVTLAVLTLRDITAQKRAEADIAASEAKFRQLAETIPQLAWMAKPDGHIFWYNRRWYEYTGTTPEQMDGWGWQRVHEPGVLPAVLERWKATISSGVSFEMEFPLRGADGVYRPFLTRVEPLRDTAGRVLQWFGTNTDVTLQRRAAEEREQLLLSERTARAEAERASRMKDEFLATLGHELRTPLNAILGWSQILAGRANSSEDLSEGLRTIERNARAQTKIIEDLLDMSRIISGKVRLDVQRIDLAGIVEEAVATAKPSAEAKEVRLHAVLDPHAGTVSGDPARLLQVMWNLISNAVKFTPRNGRVQVLLERVNSHVEISVIDSGEGIQPEFLPFVFDRFRQADGTTTRRHGGLGLGLSIVKQLVELHGGTVRVKSLGAGQGTTFNVALPLTVIHPEPDSELERNFPRSPVPMGSVRDACNDIAGVSVLVVDDEPDARALIRRLLEECDAKVQTAATANEAFELVRSQRPNVVVSDIGMADEDGYSLIRRIRTLDPDAGGRTPAIALTAYARSTDRVKAIVAGFDMHVSKPVEPAELVAMIASLAARPI